MIDDEIITRFNFEEETTNDETHVYSLNALRENYQLIWLDGSAHVDSDESIFTLRTLQNIVDLTRKFDDVQECISHIEGTSDIMTFIICSGTLGKTLVPQIHHRENIWAIYVYCYDVDIHKLWTSSYSKVKTVRTSFKYLVKDLLYNIQEYKQYKKEGGCESGLFNFIERNHTTTDIAHSGWSRFINILCHLRYPTDARKQLVDSLKDYYKNDKAKLQEVNDFEANYTAENAVSWYTRPLFLYKLLNKAFLLRDPQLIFSFGFVVHDLYRQLNEEKEKYKSKHLDDRPIFKVYRGQLMTRYEIEQLLEFLTTYDREFVEDTYITNNSFFSTTQDCDVAMAFLIESSTPDDQLQGVLLEIELDIRLKSRPYADITHLSYICDESETLIGIGCAFELDYLKYDKNKKIWICKLKLINNLDAYDIKEYESTSDRRTLKTCVAVLLHNTMRPTIEEGIKIFNMLINLFPAEEWITAAKFHFLLSQLDRQNDPEYFQKCKELIHMWSYYLDDNEINCFVEIGHIHRENLAPYYKFKNEAMAIEHYELAIICYQCAIENTSTDYERMKIYELLFWIYLSNFQYHTKDKNQSIECTRIAIKYQKLQLESMLSYHFTDILKIPKVMKWIATNHESIDEHGDALIYYERALKILQEEVKPHFELISDILKSILEIYREQKQDLHSVLKYKIIQHDYIVRDANETPIEEFNLYYVVDKKFELQMRQEKIFTSHIELAHCFLDIKNSHMAKEHLSEALQIAANVENRMWESDSEKMKTLKERLKEAH